MHTAPTLLPLNTVSDLDAALAQSAARPIVLFKHSPTCGTSAWAYEEIEILLEDPSVKVDVFLINVLANRDVSNAIAAHLNIRHESPQVLILRNGAVQWHATHYRVTAQSVAGALKSLTSS